MTAYNIHRIINATTGELVHVLIYPSEHPAPPTNSHHTVSSMPLEAYHGCPVTVVLPRAIRFRIERPSQPSLAAEFFGKNTT